VTVHYLSREYWRARPARGSTGLVRAEVRGTALHWPGMQNPLKTDAQVASALRGWQDWHMDGRGWSDIAYQVAVDQAGRAWTLRGINVRSGANGDGTVNRQYGAILLVLAPGEKPSLLMGHTVRGVIADFRRWYPAGKAIVGHKDVREHGTDCPGPLAYAGIKSGFFTPGTIAPPSTEGNSMANFTEADLKRIVREVVKDELNKQDGDLWANDKGTGKVEVIGRLERMEAAQGRIEASLADLAEP
jgi:hypothetical protein